MTGSQRDHLARWGGHALAALISLLMAALVVSLVVEGGDLLGSDFLLDSPTAAGAGGGISSVLVSTLALLAITLAVVIPLGLGTALFLMPEDGREGSLHRSVGYVLDVLAAVPSIVFALFGYQLFAIRLGLGFSLLSGGLTLACMALPLMVRTSEQALRAVPMAWLDAGQAMGLSRWGMLHKVVLPAAEPGLAAAITLSIGRALAETAVLLFTAGYVLRMPASVFDSGRALSVHIYDLAMNLPGGQPRAAASALVLVALIVVVNLITRYLLRNPATALTRSP